MTSVEKMSEAYLEGMKTGERIGTLPLQLPLSEAYLEGMKTYRHYP